MAIYVFHVFDGNMLLEVAEAECSDGRDVRVRMLEIALDFAKKSKNQEPLWSLEARDEQGKIVGMMDLVNSLPNEGVSTTSLF